MSRNASGSARSFDGNGNGNAHGNGSGSGYGIGTTDIVMRDKNGDYDTGGFGMGNAESEGMMMFAGEEEDGRLGEGVEEESEF